MMAYLEAAAADDDDPRKTGWEGVEWMHMPQDGDKWQAVVNTLMNTKGGEFLDYVSDY
jgi:hypothetical protein